MNRELKDHIGPTFGGQWDEGVRTNINSWKNIGAFNYEPRRVSKVMYEHVSSKGSWYVIYWSGCLGYFIV